jgi:CHAT domain-containing protein
MQVTTIAVARAHDVALPRLRFVTRECQDVADIACGAGAIIKSMDQSDTNDKVIDALTVADIVHFSCHGIQDSAQPHESRFCLGRGNLTVADLIEIKLQDAFLAFLSACETAKGAREHADEAVHLAASMLFAGFKSVVATMW